MSNKSTHEINNVCIRASFYLLYLKIQYIFFIKTVNFTTTLTFPKMATSNETEPMLNMEKLSFQSVRMELFAFDEETTDVDLCVDDKKLHLSREV